MFMEMASSWVLHYAWGQKEDSIVIRVMDDHHGPFNALEVKECISLLIRDGRLFKDENDNIWRARPALEVDLAIAKRLAILKDKTTISVCDYKVYREYGAIVVCHYGGRWEFNSNRAPTFWEFGEYVVAHDDEQQCDVQIWNTALTPTFPVEKAREVLLYALQQWEGWEALSDQERQDRLRQMAESEMWLT